MTTFTVNGPVRLRLSVPAGRVEVEQGDDGQVDVDLTALRNDELTRNALDEARVELVERGGRQEVRVEIPRSRGGILSLGRQVKVAVAIRCPAGCDLDVESDTADVDLRVDLGAVTVKTASGDVVAGRVAALAVTSASGDVAVGSVDGDLSVKTASGDVDARSVSGTTAINAVSGDLDLGIVDGPCTLGTVSGDIRVSSLGRGGLRANAVSGDIELAVQPDIRLWIDAQSVSGSMRSDLDLGDAPSAAEGGETVELKLRTVSGDVTIRRA